MTKAFLIRAIWRSMLNQFMRKTNHSNVKFVTKTFLRRAKCINTNSKLIILQLKTAGIKMLLINFCGCRSAKQGLFLCTILLSLLASGTSRYRYERPSRVVEIKQGRLQGTLVEVPLLSTVTSSSVKTQVIHIILSYFP